jgi:hypothetical protein
MKIIVFLMVLADARRRRSCPLWVRQLLKLKL